MLSISLSGKGFAPDYNITSSNQDKSLKKTEAVFVITFYSDEEIGLVKNQIIFSYNAVNSKQIPNEKGQVSLTVKPGKYVFKFFYNSSHNEITTDSIAINPGFRTEMRVDFRSSTRPVIMKKPVIYVYSLQTEKVSIKLNLKGNFLFTYPEYKDGWNFIANPDGSIEMGEKKYHYLFWDGNVKIEKSKLNLNEGFIVQKNELITFFEQKLKYMGLNSQEIQDYITYWCPLMNVNESNYVHFMFNNECDEYAKMNVAPKPDHLFRVYMLWSKVGPAEVKEQKIENFKRSGFTIVEWGGTEFPNLTLEEKL